VIATSQRIVANSITHVVATTPHSRHPLLVLQLRSSTHVSVFYNFHTSSNVVATNTNASRAARLRIATRIASCATSADRG